MTDLTLHVEASPAIGHGHVMRCVALAEAAEDAGLTVAFLPANAYTRERVRDLGMPVTEEPGDEWVVIDHHSPPCPQRVALIRSRGATVALLDHRGPLRTAVDLVADILMVPEVQAKLPHSPGTRYLYGLDFALLRRQFVATRDVSGPGSRATPGLMVAMGGIDQKSIAPRLAHALSAQGYRGPATFVVESQRVSEVEAAVSGWHDTRVLSEVSDMASLMAGNDLLVTKIGGTVLEGFRMGLGAVLIEPSPAHAELSRALATAYEDWPAYSFGEAADIDIYSVAKRLLAWLRDRESLNAWGRRAADLVDGLGCRRFLEAMHGARRCG